MLHSIGETRSPDDGCGMAWPLFEAVLRCAVARRSIAAARRAPLPAAVIGGVVVLPRRSCSPAPRLGRLSASPRRAGRPHGGPLIVASLIVPALAGGAALSQLIATPRALGLAIATAPVSARALRSPRPCRPLSRPCPSHPSSARWSSPSAPPPREVPPRPRLWGSPSLRAGPSGCSPRGSQVARCEDRLLRARVSVCWSPPPSWRRRTRPSSPWPQSLACSRVSRLVGASISRASRSRRPPSGSGCPSIPALAGRRRGRDADRPGSRARGSRSWR